MRSKESIIPVHEGRESRERETDRRFLEVWDKLVLGRPAREGRDVREGDVEMKERLFTAIMEETNALLDEWGIEVDAALVEQRELESDIERKAEIERKILRKAHGDVSAFIDTFDHSKERSTMWTSWPSLMRQERSFNCAGASLVGIALMDRAGMDIRAANAPGHVFTTVRLSNGERWYADFMNGKGALKKIEAEELGLAGVRALRLGGDESLRYRLFTERDKRDVIGSVLGNLDYIDALANGEAELPPGVPDIEKGFAVRYARENAVAFRDADFGAMDARLNPSKEGVRESALWKAEVERLARSDSRTRIVREVIERELTEEARLPVLQECTSVTSNIREYLVGGPLSHNMELGEDASRFLAKLKERLEALRDTDRETHDLVIEDFVRGIEKFRDTGPENTPE